MVAPRTLLPVVAAFALISGVVRADLTRFEETAAGARASVTIDGKPVEFELKIERPQKPVADSPLLVETRSAGELAPLALSRGMTVITLDLQRIPIAARAQTLRDLARRLRETMKAKRVLAHGRAGDVDALTDAGAAFDGLLLQRAEPFAAPVDPRGAKVIEVFASDAYWRPGLAAIGAEATEGASAGRMCWRQARRQTALHFRTIRRHRSRLCTLKAGSSAVGFSLSIVFNEERRKFQLPRARAACRPQVFRRARLRGHDLLSPISPPRRAFERQESRMSFER